MQWKITMLVALIAVGGCADATTESDSKAYAWMPARLIPNQFGLLNGTWANVSIRQCMGMCSADKSCSGFSVEKQFGDAWQAGCKTGLCDQSTTCHAKGIRGTEEWWLPTDTPIRAPGFNAVSNAWISEWGTVLKQ